VKKQLNILSLGLGRMFSRDPEDQKFPMAKALSMDKPEVTHRAWNAEGWWGDQGSTSECVAYAWTHWLKDGPVTHKKLTPNPDEIYHLAQKNDEWDGEDYDGTSVRAGAKVLQDKGLIGSYYWAWDVDTLVHALLTAGPVVVGTDWYSDMFSPNSKGEIKPTGYVAGGHAYVLDGVNKKTGMIRIKNSWGRTWGIKGFAFIKFADMDKLIKQQGEVCIATEVTS
jgi:hypothetical protein